MYVFLTCRSQEQELCVSGAAICAGVSLSWINAAGTLLHYCTLRGGGEVLGGTVPSNYYRVDQKKLGSQKYVYCSEGHKN